MVSHPEGDFMRPNGVKHAFKLVEHLLAMWELLQLLALTLMEMVGLPISLVDRMVVVNVSKSLDESSIAVALLFL